MRKKPDPQPTIPSKPAYPYMDRNDIKALWILALANQLHVKIGGKYDNRT